MAYGAELLARATGREPFATVDGLRMARYTMHFDDAKARRELGYTLRPYRDGLHEAIEWFIAAGYLLRNVSLGSFFIGLPALLTLGGLAFAAVLLRHQRGETGGDVAVASS